MIICISSAISISLILKFTEVLHISDNLPPSYPVIDAENLVPLGLLEGAEIINDIKQGDPITFDDVNLPENLINNLRKSQDNS